MTPATFEFFEDEAGEWRYRLREANGEIQFTSEGFTTRTDAVRGAKAARESAADAVFDE